MEDPERVDWNIWLDSILNMPLHYPPMTNKQLKSLVLKMLNTFEALGNDPMARIDCRAWAKYYRKKLKDLIH